jgi:hypothetical protein
MNVEEDSLSIVSESDNWSPHPGEVGPRRDFNPPTTQLVSKFVLFVPGVLRNALGVVVNCDLPVTWWNLGLIILLVGFFAPSMTYPLFATCRLLIGTVYPAFASYKAVTTNNIRDHVSEI